MENIIWNIRKARIESLDDDKKAKILAFLSSELTRKEKTLISGAYHFSNPKWEFRTVGKYSYCEAPYAWHAAINEWLISLGFKTRRCYNERGVDQGIEVSI
jgi:hypothetical protein